MSKQILQENHLEREQVLSIYIIFHRESQTPSTNLRVEDQRLTKLAALHYGDHNLYVLLFLIQFFNQSQELSSQYGLPVSDVWLSTPRYAFTY